MSIRPNDLLGAIYIRRNQAKQGHSLAPLIKSHSLTLYEAALIERGGVKHYLSLHLPPKGLDKMTDIGRRLSANELHV